MVFSPRTHIHYTHHSSFHTTITYLSYDNIIKTITNIGIQYNIYIVFQTHPRYASTDTEFIGRLRIISLVAEFIYRYSIRADNRRYISGVCPARKRENFDLYVNRSVSVKPLQLIVLGYMYIIYALHAEPVGYLKVHIYYIRERYALQMHYNIQVNKHLHNTLYKLKQFKSPYGTRRSRILMYISTT